MNLVINITRKKCLMHNDLHPKYNCALATSRQCGAILIHAAFFHLELIGEYEEYNTVNSIDNIEVDIQSLKDKIIHKKKRISSSPRRGRRKI